MDQISEIHGTVVTEIRLSDRRLTSNGKGYFDFRLDKSGIELPCRIFEVTYAIHQAALAVGRSVTLLGKWFKSFHFTVDLVRGEVMPFTQAPKRNVIAGSNAAKTLTLCNEADGGLHWRLPYDCVEKHGMSVRRIEWLMDVLGPGRVVEVLKAGNKGGTPYSVKNYRAISECLTADAIARETEDDEVF